MNAKLILLIAIVSLTSLTYAMEYTPPEKSRESKSPRQVQRTYRSRDLSRSTSSASTGSTNSTGSVNSMGSDTLSGSSSRSRPLLRRRASEKSSPQSLKQKTKYAKSLLSISEEKSSQTAITTNLAQIATLNNPLKFAVCKGDIECVQELLTRPHVNANMKDSNGNTALHIAAEYFNTAIVKNEPENSKIYASIIELLAKHARVQSAFITNHAKKHPQQLITEKTEEALKIRGMIFGRSSWDQAVEKVTTATLLGKDAEKVTFSDIENIGAFLILKNIQALSLDRIADNIVQHNNKDYELQQDDRLLPEFIHKTQDFLNLSFAEESVLWWIGYKIEKQQEKELYLLSQKKSKSNHTKNNML